MENYYSEMCCSWNDCILHIGHVGTCRNTFGHIINGPRATVEQCPCNKCTKPKLNKLLEHEYNPPELFIFEEVEIGGGYHTLDISDDKVESDWSEPYKKSGFTEYRSRVVKVPFPPKY